MLNHSFPEPKRHLQNASFADRDEPKDSEFTIRNNKDRELILTFK